MDPRNNRFRLLHLQLQQQSPSLFQKTTCRRRLPNNSKPTNYRPTHKLLRTKNIQATEPKYTSYSWFNHRLAANKANECHRSYSLETIKIAKQEFKFDCFKYFETNISKNRKCDEHKKEHPKFATNFTALARLEQLSLRPNRVAKTKRKRSNIQFSIFEPGSESNQ